MRTPTSLLLVALLACGPSLPVAPSDASDAFGAAQKVELEGVDPSAASAPFELLPGDVVAFRSVSAEPLEATELVVDDAGLLHVPLAGPVEVGGKDLSSAAREVEAAVQAYDRFARVTLTLVRPAGHRATVLGAVTTPGVVTLQPGMRLADVLATVGGPRVETSGEEMVEIADLAAARVVREGVALPVSLASAMRGEPRHNVLLRAGDLIYVPSTRGETVSVLGLVTKPKTVHHHPGLRLSEAITKAGGLAPGADGGDVRVVRGPLSAPKVYTASISALFAGEAADVELVKGDVVFVTEHWFASVTDVMSRLTPLLAATAIGVAVAR